MLAMPILAALLGATPIKVGDHAPTHPAGHGVEAGHPLGAAGERIGALSSLFASQPSDPGADLASCVSSFRY